MSKFTLAELATESVELLPERNTLFFDSNWAGVVATNSSLAVNAATLGSSATSVAMQGIWIVQH